MLQIEILEAGRFALKKTLCSYFLLLSTPLKLPFLILFWSNYNYSNNSSLIKIYYKSFLEVLGDITSGLKNFGLLDKEKLELLENLAYEIDVNTNNIIKGCHSFNSWLGNHQGEYLICDTVRAYNAINKIIQNIVKGVAQVKNIFLMPYKNQSPSRRNSNRSLQRFLEKTVFFERMLDEFAKKICARVAKISRGRNHNLRSLDLRL